MQHSGNHENQSMTAKEGMGNHIEPKQQKRKPRSPKNIKGPPMIGPGYTILHSKKEMELLRKKCNDELLNILEEEQQKENEREM